MVLKAHYTTALKLQVCYSIFHVSSIVVLFNFLSFPTLVPIIHIIIVGGRTCNNKIRFKP